MCGLELFCAVVISFKRQFSCANNSPFLVLTSLHPPFDLNYSIELLDLDLQAKRIHWFIENMPQYDESFLTDCEIGERKKTRSYSITSATTAAASENCKIEKKLKRWRSFKKRAPPPQTHAVYRSLYSLIENTDDTESICKLLFHSNEWSWEKFKYN